VCVLHRNGPNALHELITNSKMGMKGPFAAVRIHFRLMYDILETNGKKQIVGV